MYRFRDKDVDIFGRISRLSQSSRAPDAAPRQTHFWDIWDYQTAVFGGRTL